MENNSTQQAKEYNATAAGQRAMCSQAISDSVVMLTNAKVRALGGAAWSDAELRSMLASASIAQRDAILADIISDYNKLVSA